MNLPKPKKINAEKYVAGLSLFKQKAAKIKLSANQSALGPSPRAVKEFNKITKKFDAVRRCPDRGFECNRIAKEKLKHFVSKEAFNIDGFGKKIVEKFWELSLIKLPQDIFKLDYDKIEKLDGWGKLSADNLRYSVDEKKTNFFRKIYLFLRDKAYRLRKC